MQLKDLTSEKTLIQRLLSYSTAQDSALLVPNGDDAAVLNLGNSPLVLNTDTIVENIHFSLELSSAEDVGFKAVESAASDIVAMGAQPHYVLLALSAPPTLQLDVLDQIYAGIQHSCERLGTSIIGGDFSRSDSISITVTALGSAICIENICRRSDACIGDLVYVTGPLGGSHAGLLALTDKISGYDDLVCLHRRPRCRSDLVNALAPIAHAMIDISDGLASEIDHICTASKVGCTIEAAHIPLAPGVSELAMQLGQIPIDFALAGGEDYELLYTIHSDACNQAIGHCIGVITESTELLLRDSNILKPLAIQGFDHLRKNGND